MTNIIEFKIPLPEPTLENSHSQVDWIFKEKMSCIENKHTKQNFATALVFYKRFLEETGNYNPLLDEDPRFYLNVEWDVMALHKVKQWIEATNIEGTEGYLTSHSLTNNVGAIRRTMEYAYEHNYIARPVINVFMPTAVRETSQRAAFTNEEYTAIFNVISPMIQFSKGLLRPYRRTGKGHDPRKLCKAGVRGGERIIGQGWTCWAKDPKDEGVVLSDENEPKQDSV